ncbi:hypothetical protein GGI22_000710, partial [Coemansia erecta]
ACTGARICTTTRRRSLLCGTHCSSWQMKAKSLPLCTSRSSTASTRQRTHSKPLPTEKRTARSLSSLWKRRPSC